jgi:RecA-family ATPase
MIENAEPYAPLNGADNVIPFPGSENIRMAASEAPDVAFAQGTVGLKPFSPLNWEGAPIPPRKWCVPDYIPHATVSMLNGDGGEGKSLLTLQLAPARALGFAWVGLPCEPGRTLVISAEDDSDEMQRRLENIRKLHGATFADLADIFLVDLVGEDSILGELVKGRITPTEVYQRLDGTMSAIKPTLTTLDVLADLFGGEENSRTQVRQFINLLRHLARKHDCAILLVAHPSLTGMNTGSGLSGSTDWNNAVRSRLYFRTKPENKNLRTLLSMKSNYGERGGAFDVEWKNGVFVPVNGADRIR